MENKTLSIKEQAERDYDSGLRADTSKRVQGHESWIETCKKRLNRILVKQPHRIRLHPMKYLRWSRPADNINENFSEISIDGRRYRRLAMCKCRRLIDRSYRNMVPHLQTSCHSNPEQSFILKGHVAPESYWHDEEFGPRSRTPLPLTIYNFETNIVSTPLTKMAPTFPQSANISDDFLTRKYKLEPLLKTDPGLFFFMHALSPRVLRDKRSGYFREFVIPGFKTDDMILCLSCISILNNYANDIWNVETHRATVSHFETVIECREIINE